ncbi:hypothetical protein [Chryseobacterium viscerum]|uniref:Phage tail tape measure protein n=1 Tax=Chryseobacterium viscerum TaxID=1037377 RepID=A0A5N4BJ45_9FLAO|nr:hypothetical protein [Chryseobacterium viscerum]KAB1228458.1 hypothetical protein F8D52_22545 [Chryseobacterium viscerum]
MADDVLDILHRIAFDIDDANLEQLSAQLRRQTEYIFQLGQRQARLAQAYNNTSRNETERRQRINSLMERNNNLLQQQARQTEHVILNNRQFNDQLTRELGLIGAINARLDILQQRRRQATSESEVRRYTNLIASEQRRLNSLTSVQGNTASGFFGKLGKVFSGGGPLTTLLPALGGALSIGSLGQQIFEVTKKFEGYIQTLKNAYGSSTKAAGAFEKIQQFAAKTPYSVDELTAAFIKLKNRGFDPTTAELTKMGDLAASQGKSFDQYVEALLDAQTGEYERLKEFGIKAKTTGDTVTFSFRGIEKQVKKTDQEAIRNVILSFGELKGVVGGMAGQATTLEGKISNLGDTWDSVMFNIGKNGKGTFAQLIDLANDLLGVFNDLITKSPGQQLKEEQQEINSLFNAIASLNKGNEVRNNLIAELNAKYPQLVANLNLENLTAGQVLATLKGINNAYERRITLAQQTSIKENLAKRQGKIFADTAGDLSHPSFLGALQKTGNLADYQKAAGDLKKQKEIVDKARKQVNDNMGAFEKYKNPFNGDYEDVLSLNLGLKSASGALDKLITNIPIITKQQQIAEQGISTVKSNNQKIFDKLYDKVKREGGIDKEGKIKSEFDLRKSLGLIGSGDFVAMFDEYAPEIKVPSKPKEEEKKKKGKSPLAKAFEEIENEKKLKTELENKRKAEAEERYRKDYEADQNQFRLDLRLLKNKEANEKVLANIEISTSRKKAEALKTKKGDPGEKEKYAANLAGENANIAQSKAKLAEIINNQTNEAKKQIEQAVKNFNELNDELFSLRDQSFAIELEQLEDQHRKRVEQYAKHRKELTQQIVAFEEQGNVIVVGKLKTNLEKLNEVEKAENERLSNEKIQRIIGSELKKNNKLLDLQLLALGNRSSKEKEDFENSFAVKRERVQVELRQLQEKHISDDEIEKSFFLKKRNLKKEQAKQENLISIDRDISELFIRREGLKNDLKVLQEYGSDLVGEEKKNNEKQVKIYEERVGKVDEQITLGLRKRTEAQKEQTGTTVQEYVQMADSIVQSAQNITSAFQAQAEHEIEVRQRRVDRAKEIADRGNAEALQEEERRLDRAVKIKERFAKQQIAINLLMQASQIALAIATAAGETGIAAPVGIAIVLAALAAGFSAVKNFDSGTPGFKDGVVDFQGKGTSRSDSNLVRISRHESIINAEATAKNKAILEDINNGAQFNVVRFKPANVQPVTSGNNYDFTKLEQRLSGVENAIREKTPNSVSIDRRGFVAITEEARITDRKRQNL